MSTINSCLSQIDYMSDTQAISCWPPEDDVTDPASCCDVTNTVIPREILADAGTESSATKRQRLDDCDDEDAAEDDEPLAHVALARWWRRERRLMKASEHRPKSNNPNTLLRYAARSREGRQFLQQECRRLERCLAAGSGNRSVHAALGTFLEKLDLLDNALEHLQMAHPSTGPCIPEVTLALARVKKRLEVKAKQQSFTAKLRTCTELTSPHTVAVERREAETLSYREFLFEYALARRPVVITGLVPLMTRCAWTVDHIRQVAGDCQVPLRRLVADSVEWARLEEAGTATVNEYLDSLSKTGEDRYLFDWSLPQNCPKLAEELKIPKYFAGDFLQRTSPGTQYQDSWPSLFVAPAGLRSETHVDAFGSNFWMALFQGSKRWTIFPREDLPLLYPSYEQSLDPVFEVDLAHPDLESHPLLALTSPLQVTLRAGEVLFVPEGCAHRVENLETSVAISANYVDVTNLTDVIRHLSVNALWDTRAAGLLEQLQRQNFPCKMDSQVQHMDWRTFKAWPKDYRKHDY